MSFREWEKFRFNDICDVKGGKRLPKGTLLSKTRNLHPYIRIRDMYQNKYIEMNSEIEYVDDATFKKIDRYIVNSGDVILAIVGNTIGLVSLIGKSLDNASLTENCVKLVNLKECIAEFLYYYLISTSGQNEILKGVVGTSQPKLPIYNVQGITIELPSLREQKAIVEVLSCLDEKIEVNDQINKTLEKMAQTIFKQWFVDFEFPNEDGEPYQSSGGEMVESELGLVPKGWKVGILGDLIQITSGKRPPKRSDKNENNFIFPLVGASSVMGFSEEYNFNEAVLVIGRVGTHGIIQRFDRRIWASDNTLVIRSKMYEYVYQILNSIDD